MDSWLFFREIDPNCFPSGGHYFPISADLDFSACLLHFVRNLVLACD